MSDFMTRIEQEIEADQELAKLSSQEELIGTITELILEQLRKSDMARSDLANILDTSTSHLTQLLQGTRNMTVRTLSDIFFGLGYQLILDVVPSKLSQIQTTSETPSNRTSSISSRK